MKTETYEILPSKKKKAELGYKRAIVLHGLRKLLADLGGQGEMTFLFKNAYVPQEEYMESVLLTARTPELSALTEEYNQTLKTAAAKGHNNYSRKMYLESGDGLEEILQEDLKELYGYEARRVIGKGRQASRGSRPSKRLYLYNIPPDAADTLFNDLLGVAADSELVVRMQPIEPHFAEEALGTAGELQAGEGKQALPGREKGKQAHRTGPAACLPSQEENCFFRAATPVIKEAEETGEPLFLTEFCIFLYGENDEEVGRDAQLLATSALKYGGMVREGTGFAPRVFTAAQVANMLPVNIHAAFETKPLLQGTNPVNNSIILSDRGNAYIGLITGAVRSGKTAELKKEAVHSLLTTEDEIYVVTARSEEWEDVGESLVLEAAEKDEDYGLTRPADVMETVYRKAYEVMQLFAGKGKTGASPKAPLAGRRPAVGSQSPGTGKMGIVEVNNAEELLLTIDNLWNKAIAAKKENRGIQIFVDGIDAFFFAAETSDYLLAILSGCEVLHVPVTVTVQDAAAVCGDPDAAIEFECFLRTVTFAKLLNQGPVERRALQEAFALPDALIQGVADQMPGYGVLITPEKTVRFEAAGYV